MSAATETPEATDTTVREALQELIAAAADEIDVADYLSEEAGAVLDCAETGSFEDLGVLTGNEGLTLRLADGSEFQITIVRSR